MLPRRSINVIIFLCALTAELGWAGPAGVGQAVALAGVEAPHDLAVVAAPVRLAGSERPVAVLVAETRASGSRLHKFFLLPQGALLPLYCPVQRGTGTI